MELLNCVLQGGISQGVTSNLKLGKFNSQEFNNPTIVTI